MAITSKVHKVIEYDGQLDWRFKARLASEADDDVLIFFLGTIHNHIFNNSLRSQSLFDIHPTAVEDGHYISLRDRG